MSHLPFTSEQFLQVFARYNLAIWPAQWVLIGLALIAVGLSVPRPATSNRIVSAILAGLWFWMGAVYHVIFFAPINPAARLFGAAFVLEGVLLLWMGVATPRLPFRAAFDVNGVIGGALLVYALVVYPLIGYVAGHRFPATPTFGVPCPTTIFTLGLLLWISGPVRRRVVVIPAAWALVATFAALRLSVPQDYGLPVAAAVTLALLARRSASRRNAGTSSQRISTIPTPAQRQ